jgi:hypothetical protein
MPKRQVEKEVTTVIRFEYMEMQALWKYSGERI